MLTKDCIDFLSIDIYLHDIIAIAMTLKQIKLFHWKEED